MSPLTNSQTTRRAFLVSAVGAFAAIFSACKPKGKYDINKFKELKEIDQLLTDHTLTHYVYPALTKAITLQQKPDTNSNEDFQLATLWLLRKMIADKLISLKNAREKSLLENLAKATKIKISRIEDNYSPLSYAIYNYLTKDKIHASLPKALQSTITLIGDNHRHLPVVSADGLKTFLTKALDIRYVTDSYAKFMYATLFMICALEVGDSCNQPALCGYKRGQFSAFELFFYFSQPKTDGYSAFGMYQMIRETFQRMGKNIKRGGGIDLDYRNPAHQLLAASRLIHEKLSAYLNSQNLDLGEFVNSIVNSDNSDKLENLAEFLSSIDNPVWAALSSGKATKDDKYGRTKTTVRGALFLRGLELASTMQKAR